MSLRVPPIDQRSFDDLVDEARRRIAKDCPTWTGLSIHDPGLVLIEALAHLTETLIARLNRVPERVYVELLKLIGVQLLPPSAAEATLTFTLSKAADRRVEIPAGTQVGSGRQAQRSEPLLFTTAEAAAIPPGELQATVRAVHAELVAAELVGYGTGQPGLAVRVKRAPIVAPVIPRPGLARARGLFDLELGVEMAPGEQEVRERVRVHDGKRFALWEERETFADTAPGDRVFTVDRASGLIVFPPAVEPVREADAAPQVRPAWAAPGAGRMILAWYARGGGEEGNVMAGALDSLTRPLPGGEKPAVTNPAPAAGGRAVETLAHALGRGPRELHALRRAVTASDFELLAIRSGLAARARAYTLADLWVHAVPGTVGVALVPAIPAAVRGEADEGVTAELLARYSTDDARAKALALLDERRPLGTRLSVEWVAYKPVGVAATLVIRRGDDAAAARHAALGRINRLLSPLPGDAGGGWPFQRALRASQIYDVLLADPAVSYATSVRLLLPDGLADVGAMAADPFQPATFYACSGDRLYRSVNDGLGWEPIRTFPGEVVEKVVCHPDHPGLLAVVTQLPGNRRPSVIRRSWTCGQRWDADEARLDGVEDIAWNLGGGPPSLLIAGTQGLHEWTAGKAPLEVGMGGGVPTKLFAVAVARHARGEVTVAVAAQDRGGVAVSRHGGGGGTFEPIGLIGEEIRLLETQQRDDGRSFLWAGSTSIGDQIGKGFYRCELLGAEREPEPWEWIAGWEGASALCLAFLGNLALAGSYEAGVLWTDTHGDKLAWTRPDLRCGLPLRDKPRLFAPVRGLAVSPRRPLILAGGPAGLVAGETPEAYAPRAGRETADEVTLPPDWLFCAGPHALEVRGEDDAP